MELLLIPTALLALLLWQEKQAHREAEAEWRDERRSLLNRIQAPETAKFESVEELSEEPLFVPPDDDEAYEQFEAARAEGRVI